MKFIVLLLLVTSIAHTQEENTNRSIPLEFGITGLIVDLSFPAFDFDLIVPFYRKGINSVAFKTSIFTYIRGNAYYKPIFVDFGVIWELQYKLLANNGFVFSLETGLGVIGEFLTTELFSLEKGFHKDTGKAYGIFSAGLRIGYNFSKKFDYPWQLTILLGYRMQFPFNLSFNDLQLLGISLSYTFDTGKKGSK